MTASRHSQLLRTIPVLFAVCLLTSPAQAQYSGGSGTADDPYQIATTEDLLALGRTPSDYDKHYVLIADIDMSGLTSGRPVIASGVGFTGVFDGNGRAISNLTLRSTYRSLALFGTLGAEGEIKDLGVVNARFQSPFSAGVLVLENEGTLVRCYSTGSVRGAAGIGGLAAYNDGVMVQCYSTCEVRGHHYTGGLVGTNAGLLIQCFGAGSVADTGPSASSTSRTDFGGLVGRNAGEVTYCYSAASVDCDALVVGGLVGLNMGSITCCYSTGGVSDVSGVPGGSGGLTGHSDPPDGFVDRSFGDVDSSGQDTSEGGTPLSTADMYRVQTYLDAGWDWIDENENGTSDVWQMPEGGGYPILAAWSGRSPVRLDGLGTAEQPYLISNAAELGAVAHYDPRANYRLIAPIDLAGVHWSAAAIPTLTGTFDGNGGAISNLTIEGGEYVGLVGRIAPRATVRWLEVMDVNVTGGGPVGGLAGWNQGDVIQCTATGRVQGEEPIGGLVGINDGRVKLSRSSATVDGHYSSECGGLIGLNREGHVVCCYSTGTVSSGGGLIGFNEGYVTQCYSTGIVETSSPRQQNGLMGYNYGIVDRSFWDVSTSKRVGSAAGTGLTSVQMQDIQTYLDAGWDWIDETENGTSQIWQMPEGGGYPIVATLNGYVPPQLQGRGTPDDPYLILSAPDIGAVLYYDPYASYRLAADLDLEGISWAMAPIPWFEGEFDGDNRTISNLTIEGGGYVGLFGQLALGAEVENFGLVDIQILGSNAYVGGLAGHSNAAVHACYVTGMVTGGDETGGLIGRNAGKTLYLCYSTASVDGGDYVGGLIGYNQGDVADSYSSGTVTGDRLVGGLVGASYGAGHGTYVTRCYTSGSVGGGGPVGGLVGSGSNLMDCYSSADVSGDGNVGGLLGTSSGQISNCHSSGAVHGTGWRVGGLIGTQHAFLDRCYCTGPVTADRYVGGLVGDARGYITQCWSSGSVGGNSEVGGLIGYASGYTRLSFWDVETSGQTTSSGGTGKPTAQMQTASTFLNAYWDFVGETDNGTDDIWWIEEGIDYPRLWWERSSRPDPNDETDTAPVYRLWSPWNQTYTAPG